MESVDSSFGIKAKNIAACTALHNLASPSLGDLEAHDLDSNGFRLVCNRHLSKIHPE